MKVYHTNTKCCICGSGETYIYQGSPKWHGHICNKKNCTGYICRNCNRVDPHKTKEYNLNKRKNRKCYVCGSEETYVKPNGDLDWRKYPNVDRWDGKSYICKDCYNSYRRSYYHDIGKFDPDSISSWMRSNANVRTGKISSITNNGLGIIVEYVICAERNIRNNNVIVDNFTSKIDLTIDEEYGIIQSRSAVISYGEWRPGPFDNINFDNAFICCIDKWRKNIERVYVIPKELLFTKKSLVFYKKPSKNVWYDNGDYRIDEKPYNDAYKNLMNYIKNKELFSIDDLEKWLEQYGKRD